MMMMVNCLNRTLQIRLQNTYQALLDERLTHRKNPVYIVAVSDTVPFHREFQIVGILSCDALPLEWTNPRGSAIPLSNRPVRVRFPHSISFVDDHLEYLAAPNTRMRR